MVRNFTSWIFGILFFSFERSLSKLSDGETVPLGIVDLIFICLESIYNKVAHRCKNVPNLSLNNLLQCQVQCTERERERERERVEDIHTKP
ncbi:hypothetical protein NC653_017330 [Populus alba x Populus x berolinensis]|uniref:Secreted protein n=1 Tax=Populus alba x Populus x berolinensis TaxID=444605 RepID=A0AAD6W0G8_9ROSI|nr:hypothetical protein NC653_017330 [Populus alba x Populus x berolinensis]